MTIAISAKSVIITHMPKGIPIPPDEIQAILDSFIDCRKRGVSIVESYRRVGEMLKRDERVIGQVIARYRPTTDMAKMYLRAKSLKLVKRLVKKASPAEIINILERPSIGVLDGVKKVGDTPGGFFISVDAGSCGAVKVGVAQAGALPPVDTGTDEAFDPFHDAVGGFTERNDYAGGAQNGEIRATETRREDGDAESEDQRAISSVVSSVRKRLEAARSRVG